MDKFCIHALESLLRGSEWDDDFRCFYLTICPRFRSFTESRNYSDGSGYDILMFEAHNDFRAFFDSKLQIYLAEMGVSFETFSKSLTLQLIDESSVALKLQSHLEMYCDFEKFSIIMQSKFEENFAVKSLDFFKHYEDAGLKSISVRPNSQDIIAHQDAVIQDEWNSYQNVLPIRSKAVRVLWDIENIPVKKNLGGFNALSKLNRFLKDQNLQGTGIDCRVSAFFAPLKGKTSRNVIQELDKGAVELIWVSSKREDADRKLGTRIQQEMIVLKPSDTTFVIISSDQDFRHSYQLLSSSGYEVIVIHNVAQDSNSLKVLAMYASRTYSWTEIMSKNDTLIPNSVEKIHDILNSDGTAAAEVYHNQSTVNVECVPLTNITSKQLEHSGINANQSLNGPRQNDDVSDVGMSGQRCSRARVAIDIANKLLSTSIQTPPLSTDEIQTKTKTMKAKEDGSDVALGWVVGTCVRWKGAFGFLSVSVVDRTCVTPTERNCTCVEHTGCTDYSRTSVDEAPVPSPVTVQLPLPVTVPVLTVEHGQYPLRVYVHYKSLRFDPPAMQLKRGQTVRAVLKKGDKGFFAVRVEDFAPIR